MLSIARALVPTRPPGAGEQYAFELDLDACTACKSCVTACYAENGLDDGESWRFVGQLVGHDAHAAALRTVSSSCHHCLEPACLQGCPARAYDKDSITGIVRHLDDACIGCQYCTFTCPYDVPQFNAARGIVRKCDMCADRLAGGTEPACVAACPHGAIRIRLAAAHEIVADSEARAFLPGAPDPAITLPTTTYATARALPRNTLPADYHAARPGARHAPLVWMLVLTQLSVGTLAANLLAGAGRDSAAWLAAAAGVAAMAASLLHLGRPERAWRAVLGLRRSWLSREIVAFGAFAALSCGYAVHPARWLGVAAAAVGVGAVGASAMVYAATRRECWRLPRTGLAFFGTTTVLGAAVALALAAGTPAAPRLCGALAIASLVKLGGEALLLARARDRRPGVDRRVAELQLRDLPALTGARFALGGLGGIALPLLYLAVHRGPDVGPVFLAVLTAVAAAALVAGELAERTLFFAAAVAPRMPGAQA